MTRTIEWIVGLTLIVSAALKGYELSLFMMQIAGYRLLPTGTEGAMAGLIVVAEAALGMALIAGAGWRSLPHWLTILLLAGFSGVFVYGLVSRGIEECGCFGDFLKLPPAVTLAKNAVLVLILIVAIVLRWGKRAVASRRMLAVAGVLGLISVAALAVGARHYVVEERAKEAMAAGPVAPERPYARFRFDIDGKHYDLGSGMYFVVWLSTTCKECKEAVAPLGELKQLMPELPPVVGFCLGNQSTLKDFRDETKPSFGTILVPMNVFMKYDDADPPRYTLVRDGQVVAQWDAHLPAPMELAERIAGM